MSEILVIGSSNADIVACLERVPIAGETVLGESLSEHCGGKGANQAFAAGRLGGRVAMLGCVGDDERGERQKRNLAREGVLVDGVRAVGHEATGSAVVMVERGGENRIVVVAGANAAYDKALFSEDADKLAGSRIALLQLETPLETVAAILDAARVRGVTTILDPAPAQPLSRGLLAKVDYLTPNLSELGALTGRGISEGDCATVERAARGLLDSGVGGVVAKLGSSGAMLVSSSAMYRVPGYNVDVVDTTAASDCFNGAFSVALCEGRGEEEALRFACAAAALSVTRAGAQASLPSRSEVDQFMRRRGEAVR